MQLFSRFTTACAAIALVVSSIPISSALSSHDCYAKGILQGSKASMNWQHQVRLEHGLKRFQDAGALYQAVEDGTLVPIIPLGSPTLRNARDDADCFGNVCIWDSVSHPYLLPETKLFVERFANQMRLACGQRLVVTSGTRIHNNRFHRLSVHPSGMAVDLRNDHLFDVSQPCRNWMDRVLRLLDEAGVIEATQECRRPHFHIAVHPTRYLQRVARLQERFHEHPVEQGESLSMVARKYGVTSADIRQWNNMRSSVVHPGQTLRIPREKILNTSETVSPL